MTRMPVVFAGHGSPMLAIEDNETTGEFRRIGEEIIAKYGRPKAILAISAHWYTDGTFIQSTETPKQIYDMYGFPKELYELSYPADGSPELADEIQKILGDKVQVDNEWGIDHGTWSVLVHMFPDADIPVVQLSIDGTLTSKEYFELGEKLSSLREQGVLIFGSGNIVHNLHRIEPGNPGGSTHTREFSDTIVEAVEKRDDAKVIGYEREPNAPYAVPTPEHFLPLLYVLGAAGDDKGRVFNNEHSMGSISMAGFTFGLE